MLFTWEHLCSCWPQLSRGLDQCVQFGLNQKLSLVSGLQVLSSSSSLSSQLKYCYRAVGHQMVHLWEHYTYSGLFPLAVCWEKVFTFSLITLIPLSSEAFSSSTLVLNISLHKIKYCQTDRLSRDQMYQDHSDVLAVVHAVLLLAFHIAGLVNHVIKSLGYVHKLVKTS